MTTPRKTPPLKSLDGTLEAFFETGTEGILWSFNEAGKRGYDSLNVLEDGDLLTVFNDASCKEVLWQGEIHLEYKNRWQPYPLNSEYGQQAVLGLWVHGLQEDMDPEKWAQMFLDEKPARLIKKKNQILNNTPAP